MCSTCEDKVANFLSQSYVRIMIPYSFYIHGSYIHSTILLATSRVTLNKNTLGVKKVQGQSEAALQIGMYDQKL